MGQWVCFCLLFCFRKTGMSILYGEQIITPLLVESFVSGDASARLAHLCFGKGVLEN